MTAFALVCFICGVKKLLNVYTLYTREVVEGLVYREENPKKRSNRLNFKEEVYRGRVFVRSEAT